MPIDERLVFFEGKYVRLKALDEMDVIESGWVGWFNSESLSKYNAHHYFPNTFEAQRDYLSHCSGPDRIALGIVNNSNPDSICGIVSLQQINLIHRNCEIAGISSNAPDRNDPNLFYEAWSIMLRHAFEQLGMEKVYGGTFHPHVAKALKRAFNFESEGVRKRQVFKNGKFLDVELVSVFSKTIKYPEL